MRTKGHLLLGLALMAQLACGEAANSSMINPRGFAGQPGIVAKTADRSYSGAVQEVLPGPVLRLRDDRLGDMKVVITATTQITKDRRPATSADITPGTRIHGYAAFRGGRLYAKVATID